MRKLIESLSGAIQMAVHLVLWPLFHPWRTRWGATEKEIARKLPGDELVPKPEWSYNHAISINAPRSAVWPWLVQLGQGRGGFYTYEGLENLIGCQIRNVMEIRPDLQRLRVGDTIVTHGRSGFGPAVTLLEAERALVLGGPPNQKGSQSTWAFHLLDGPNGTTRLIERLSSSQLRPGSVEIESNGEDQGRRPTADGIELQRLAATDVVGDEPDDEPDKCHARTSVVSARDWRERPAKVSRFRNYHRRRSRLVR